MSQAKGGGGGENPFMRPCNGTALVWAGAHLSGRRGNCSTAGVSRGGLERARSPSVSLPARQPARPAARAWWLGHGGVAGRPE
eukprot:4727315-Pyramimonas_sp.AAC.1